jgi:hypothetical protein
MTEDKHDYLGAGINYEARLPLAWKLAPESLNETMLGQYNDQNEKYLRIISILNEYPTEQHDDHASVDFKLSIMLDLLGELLATHLMVPPKSNVRIGSMGMEWLSMGKNIPEKDSKILIDLYMHHQYPRPVIIPAEVKAVVSNEDGYRCVVKYFGLADTVQDLLEKVIFTHHRRSIAHSRQQ